MLARLATLFAAGNPDFVGMAVNGMNSIASAFCSCPVLDDHTPGAAAS